MLHLASATHRVLHVPHVLTLKLGSHFRLEPVQSDFRVTRRVTVGNVDRRTPPGGDGPGEKSSQVTYWSSRIVTWLGCRILPTYGT
jgi:hypothetical protein